MTPSSSEIQKVMSKAQSYLDAQHYRKAEQLVGKALERFGKSAALLSLKGILHQKQSKFLEATMEFRAALEADPHHTESALNLAVLLADTGQYISAEEEMGKLHQNLNTLPHGSSKLKPIDDRLYAALAEQHNLCAELYTRMDRPELAIEEYQKALTLQTPSSQRAETQLHLIRLLIKIQDFPRAKKELETLMEANPEDSEIYITFGMLHYKMGHLFLAKKMWQKAAQLDPKSSKARAFSKASETWSPEQ